MKHAFPCAAVIAGIGLLSGSMALAADLSVGPGQAFPRVEAALAAAVFAAYLPTLRKLVRWLSARACLPPRAFFFLRLEAFSARVVVAR